MIYSFIKIKCEDENKMKWINILRLNLYARVLSSSRILFKTFFNGKIVRNTQYKSLPTIVLLLLLLTFYSTTLRHYYFERMTEQIKEMIYIWAEELNYRFTSVTGCYYLKYWVSSNQQVISSDMMEFFPHKLMPYKDFIDWCVFIQWLKPNLLLLISFRW